MGSLLKRIVLARFARTLTLMIRSGVPIIDGLNLVAQASGNRYMLFYSLPEKFCPKYRLSKLI